MVVEGPTNQWKNGINLSHISSRWRIVALGSSELWSLLKINSPAQWELMPLFAQRSRKARLNLIVGHFELGRSRFIPGLAIRAGEAPQIRSVVFHDLETVSASKATHEALALLNLESAVFGFLDQSFQIPRYLVTVRNLSLHKAHVSEASPTLSRLMDLAIQGIEEDALI